MARGSIQGQGVTSALSQSETNVLICSTSSTPAANSCTSDLGFFCVCVYVLEDAGMSLFSSKSVGEGSNQRLSFLGTPRAFCKGLRKLAAFMLAYASRSGSPS